MTDPKMTLHDMAEAMRANGIPCSEDRLRDMILAGQFRFAYGVAGYGADVRNRATVLIFRHAFYQWLDDMLGAEAVRV